MIDPTLDSLPLIAKFKEAIYSFAVFGMTQQVQLDMKMILSAIVVGVLSAFGSSYVAADRTSAKLDAFVREQAEFRQEMRDYIKSRNAEILTIYERQARIEAKVDMAHAASMSGMNGNGRKP